MTTIYDINELQALIERQVMIINMYDKAVENIIKNEQYINTDLLAAYEASQNTHAMTGASEK